MFNQNEWWHSLKAYESQTLELGDKDEWQCLFQVELGLRLLENLNLQDEPITVLWVLLNGLPFQHHRLPKIGSPEYTSIAIARVLLPFAARFTWENELREYARLPEEVRYYRVAANEAIPLKQQLVANIKLPNRSASRLHTYDTILNTAPADRKDELKFADAGTYEFTAYTRNHEHQIEHTKVRFSLTPDTIISSQNPSYPDFDLSSRERTNIEIPFKELETTAIKMDERLQAQNQDATWSNRFHQFIRYHSTTETASTSLKIDGVTHLVGMVGSGKSTLMKFIAAHTILFHNTRRVTLVVGTTMDALNLSHELNTLLSKNPERPVAVPILGRSTRDNHLEGFYNADIDHKNHWGQRWLSSVCPLQGDITIDTMSTPLIPGREPCERLYAPSKKKDEYSVKRVCPLFQGCPSHQTFHDLPLARVWITTPGGLDAVVPFQRDSRRPKVSILVYEQSDLVIFDEADTIQAWFDDKYAEQIQLWGTTSAIFNRIDLLTSQVLTSLERQLTTGEDRWKIAERRSTDAILAILRQLAKEGDYAGLSKWVEPGSFTAFILFARLAQLLAGVTDLETTDDFEIEEKILAIREKCFDPMIEGDPLEIASIARGVNRFDARLAQIMSRLLETKIETILQDCEIWIEDVVLEIVGINIENLLEIINTPSALSQKYRIKETKRTLAHKLVFALSVALLDRNLRIVFFEWYHQPPEINDEIGIQPYRPNKLGLRTILPLPSTGSVFGTYVRRENGEVQPQSLARFEYSNIGRWMLLHFHDLLAPLGRPGPNTLLLSATSWIPGSTRWHIDIPVTGILEADVNHIEAISQKSTFTFLPQFSIESDTKRPISISGSKYRDKDLISLSRCIKEDLKEELNKIRERGEKDKDWEDRARLLIFVNSYSQAELFAKELETQWDIDERHTIMYVRRNDNGEEVTSSIRRSEIEGISDKEIRILVAPLEAIGRGYNILNSRDQAAFGAIYFLIRPMPHPYDVQTVAAELNARTLEWCREESSTWHKALLYDTGIALREHAKNYLYRAEQRQGYVSLVRDKFALRDFATTTFGRIVQACGRVLRGGVPFDAFFVDAKWAPETAKAIARGEKCEESYKTSLLAAVVREMTRLIDEGEHGEVLYRPFEGLLEIKNFNPDLSED